MRASELSEYAKSGRRISEKVQISDEKLAEKLACAAQPFLSAIPAAKRIVFRHRMARGENNVHLFPSQGSFTRVSASIHDPTSARLVIRLDRILANVKGRTFL